MIKELKEILTKTYDNPVLRRTTTPLIITNPGMGKTQVIKEFAKEKGVNMYTMILSQLMPYEVSGQSMPDLVNKKQVICDSELLLGLKDGDILFIDECLTALKQTLDAFLNLLQDRTLPSGQKLADVLIIACSNPQGQPHLTAAIKQRFIMYELKFDAQEFQDYLKENYGMPESISKNLSILINKEKFESDKWNYWTPRSIEKSINQIGCDLQSPYDTALMPFLTQKIKCPKTLSENAKIKEGQEVEYLTLLKLIVKERNHPGSTKLPAKEKTPRKSRAKKEEKVEELVEA